MTDTQAGLLPCPCCNGEAFAQGGDIPTSKQITIMCDGPQPSGVRGCGIRITGKRLRLSHAELLTALTERWNTRPSPPASAERMIPLAIRAYNEAITNFTENEQVTRMRAALQASGAAVQVPEGWKLVPIEATTAMLVAGVEAVSDGDDLEIENSDIARGFAAMLAAAPQKQGA